MSEALKNEIHVYFGKLTTTTTAKVSQWAYGQKLIVHDADLPSVFEAYYSNSRSRGEAKPQIGTGGEVPVPDEYFISGADIYVFLMEHEGADDGRYHKIVHIPIDPCSKPVDVDPTPQEQSVIDQAIAALNQAVEQCGAYVEHYPTVIDGEWCVWDESTEHFVSTGVPATGNGIADARLNNDYTLTLVFTDGSSFTTPISIRGAQGEKGDTGAVPNFTVGTVTTLPAGSSASVSITGTQEEPVLNLSIPQGQDGAITNLDTTLTVSGKAADAKAVGDRFDDIPKISETDADGTDLDIADSSGNVLVRFANGHIRTNEFDSKNVINTDPTNTDDAFDLTDSEGYVLARFQNGHIQTKEFNSEYVLDACEYLFDEDGSILLSYGYNDTHDAVVSMNEGRANGLFDYKWLKLKPKGKPLADCQLSDFETVWLTGTDMHSPFEFLVVNNPDGYYSGSTDPGYTGGNHTVDISGTAVTTAKSNGVRYYADGKPVTDGHGVFTKFEMRWANEIQAYNCVKADGTGRTSLTEYHDMIFDGVTFDEEVVLIPNEDIRMSLWHGLQAVGWNGVYDHVYFLDATNRQIFVPTDSNIKSGNAITSGVVQYGDAHAMRMDIDITRDLGKRPHYSGTEGAFMSSSIHKGYFRIFYGTPVLMAQNSTWYLHGSFRFYPV